MACIIKVNGVDVSFTAQQLITFLASNQIDNIDKLKNLEINGGKFSLQEEVTSKISSVIADSTYKASGKIGDDYSFGNTAITATQLIDKEGMLKDSSGNSIFGINMAVSREDFRYQAKQQLFNNTTMSETEIDDLIIKAFLHWDTIKEDSKLLHQFITECFQKKVLEDSKYSDFVNILEKEYFKPLYSKLQGNVTSAGGSSVEAFHESLIRIKALINSTLVGIRTGNYTGTSYFSKYLKAQTELETVGIHIDQMYVDDNGDIHVFNYKITSTNSDKWAVNKSLKYAHEAAIIKKIMLANGIPVETIDSKGVKHNHLSLYNIPIVVEYSKDCDKMNVRRDASTESISYLVKDEKAILPEIEKKYENTFKTDVPFRDLGVSTDFAKSSLFSQLINPEYDAEATGLKLTAISWIKENNGKKINFKNNKWEIILDDGTIKTTTNPAPPLNNIDIIRIVTENLDFIQSGQPVVMQALVDEIINNYSSKGGFKNRRGFRFNADYINDILGPYLETKTDAFDREYHTWKFIKNEKLWTCGILLFQNSTTGQIDIVVPSAYKINERIQSKRGRNKLLGYYVDDMNSPIELKGTYGNMEIMRALAVINEVLPDLQQSLNDNKEAKLGAIKVITPFHGGEGIIRSFKELVPEFNKTLNFIKDQNPELDMDSNYSRSYFIDPVELIYETLKNAQTSKQLSDGEKALLISGMGLDGITDLRTKEQKVIKLQEIIEYIENKYTTNIKGMLRKRNSLNQEEKLLAEIYIEAVKGVNAFNGMYTPAIERISNISRLFLPQYANPDNNVRFIANLYQRGLENVAQRFQKEYSPIRDKILKSYETLGYGKVQSAIIGSAESVYSKMYKKTLDTNKNTWEFVNPYDIVESRELSAEEVKLLKFLLFNIAKVRAKALGYKFEYTNENDPKLKEYIKSNMDSYFLVPLEKGSAAHFNKNPLSKVSHYKQEAQKLKQRGLTEYLKQRITERQAQEDMSDGSYEQNIEQMSLSNTLVMSLDTNNSFRQQFLSQHEDSYFETNIEYLIADCLEKQIALEEMQKVAFYGKCLLTQMHLLGDQEGVLADKQISTSIKEIENYMKLNIFGKSIMEMESQQAMELIAPAKKLMTRMFIMSNLRSAFRDSFEGVWQNTVRTMSKYQTDLTATSVKDGYKTVLQDIFHSDRSMNILSELCLRYRLSNVDASRIAERAKTGRGGIFNPDQWGYSTLRGPDFLNRMTLFAARCKQDGVWDAFSIKDNALIYDWKKDKRFKAFHENPSSEEGLKAKALYYNTVSQYNLEHPSNTITFNPDETPLPEPYSQNEIRQFKMFSDGIYGAYDKSQKAMYENLALGQTLGVFSTWLNGKTAAWFRRPGVYPEYFETTDKEGNLIIKKDPYSGNELYFDDNGGVCEKIGDNKYINENKEEINIDNPMPVYDKVPVPVQGIYYTLKDTIQLFADGGSFKEFKDTIWGNKYQRANFKQAQWDLTMWLLFAALFGLLFTPAYEEHKKSGEGDVIADGFIELIYKSSANSYDGFKGAFSLIDYAINDVQPAAPGVSVKVVSDLGRTVMGKEGWAQFAFGNVPVLRTFKETAKKEGWLKRDSE